MGHRRRSREYALQMLFQIDLAGGSVPEVFQQFWHQEEADDETRDFAEHLVSGVLSHGAALDAWIRASADHWRLERMAVVDRNVLRIAVFELMNDPQTPPPVVIDEAIEIAKRFGSEDSGSFINGILDSILRRSAEPLAEAHGNSLEGTS